jgi:hypothetical protein
VREVDGGLLTMAVRRMLLDLPAQLGDIAPPPGTARVVELRDIAQRLVALGVVLLQRELECAHDVARGARGAVGSRTGNVPPLCFGSAYRCRQSTRPRQSMFEGGVPGERRRQRCKCPSHSARRRGVNAAPLSLGAPLAAAIQKSSPSMPPEMPSTCSHCYGRRE